MHRVSDLCPYIKMKSMQITASFAPANAQGCVAGSAARSTLPKGWRRYRSLRAPLAKQGLSWHAALTRTGAVPGRQRADIPALPVKSAFQRLCLGVGKNKEGLPVHMQNSALCCPNCQAVAQDRSTSPPVPSPLNLYHSCSVAQAPFLSHLTWQTTHVL